MSDLTPLNPEEIIKVLAQNKVKYVLIGALAARLQGFPRLTADADITPATDIENLERLSAALKQLKAKVFTDSDPGGLSFDCSAKNITQSEIWNLITSAGRLDIVFKPAGTNGYEDFIEHAKTFNIFGTKLMAADLRDIIRSKKVSDRPQDRQDIIILQEILERE